MIERKELVAEAERRFRSQHVRALTVYEMQAVRIAVNVCEEELVPTASTGTFESISKTASVWPK